MLFHGVYFLYGRLNKVLYSNLGRTGLEVSRICFGTLTIGPLQRNYTVSQGTAILQRAVENGINFFDSAESYATYPYLKKLIQVTDKQLIIASKSYAYTYKGMMESIEKARKEINRDYIDIFLMHEQESILTLKGHSQAWEALIQAREKGLVRGIGISTHHVKCVSAAQELEGIDVIHPIVNYKGLGIVDSTISDMLQEINKAKEKGIGIYGMKPLGGGNLSGNYLKALQYAFSIKELDSIALGMQSPLEIDANCMILEESPIPESLHNQLLENGKILHIEPWCIGCGKCVEKCSQGALQINDFKEIIVEPEKCILCGYCSTVCQDFCIKVF